MLEPEARWLRERLAEIPAAELSPLLNLGSSDLDFRARVQPWIDREVFAPLRARGVQIVHSDLKAQPGVDLAADALDPADQAALRAVGARSVLCSNMLEHVAEPAALARACLDLVPPGGRLIITAPASYPYHPDPIDTYYRREPDALCRELFAELRCERADVVEGRGYGPELARRPWLIVRDLRALAELRRSPSGLAGSRLAWLRRPYRISCAVLRRG